MRCLLDTNILISAALFPAGVPAQAFMKAVSQPHNAVVCDYALVEMRRVYNRKFPHKIPDFEKFLSLLTLSVEIVPAPGEAESVMKEEQKIRKRFGSESIGSKVQERLRTADPEQLDLWAERILDAETIDEVFDE